MANQFQLNGSTSGKQTRYTGLWNASWTSGIWTNRSPLREGPVTRMEARYIGARNDCFWDGSNIEISQRLTPVRRPGHTEYNTSTFSAIDCFYEFRLFNTNTETIKVMADTAATLYDATGPSGQIAVWSKSAGAGQTYMQYVANILYFGNGVDLKKWVQNPVGWLASYKYTVDGMETFVIDSNGNLEQLTQCVIPVVSIGIASNILTVTYDRDVTNYLTPGLNINFINLVAASFLNNYDPKNQVITISNVSGSTVTADFVYNNYPTTADTGTCYVVEGGTPYSAATVPMWNTALMGTTTDNVCLWTNRGTPLENFGIVGPTQQTMDFTVNTNSSSWADNTYYSMLDAIIDDNGNLQKVTTGGKSGYYGSGNSPNWATTLSGTTSDGTVVWTVVQIGLWNPSAPDTTTWLPSHTYTNGDLITATPTGGDPSVFQLQSFSEAQVSGNVTAYLYPKTGAVTQFNYSFPLSTGSASASATGNSFLFSEGSTPFMWATLAPSGAITGYTNPFPGYVNNYELVVLGNIIFPEPGNYTISIAHKDGMFWGMGNSATVVSGPSNDPRNNTVTAVEGYPVFGGTNTNPAGLKLTDDFIVNIPTAGTYPVEIDYAYWYHSDQTLVLTVNGINPVPGTLATSRTSGPSAPIWPAFSSSYAPGYATANETSGQLVWANLGPVTDFSWTTKTYYLTNSSAGIIDSNSYSEIPYESGTTTTLAPTFVKTLNGITADNPNLIWINTGKASVKASGNLSTSAGGWNYCIALVNTLTDTASNAGPVTDSTNSFVGASGVSLSGGLPAANAIDPQADYVAIFRTKDGGGTYYLIPSTYNQNTVYTLPLSEYLANGYTDTTLDADLNFLISPALSYENTPPGTVGTGTQGMINFTYHLNRLFASTGNIVYWSTGPDTNVGNGNEAWSPSNSFTFPSLVKRIVSTSIGALIFTVSDVYLIAGKATASSPLFPTPYVPGLGLLSYNALSTNGTLIYLLTADNQFVELNPHSGVSQLGNPIGDKLQTWDPSLAYVAWHVSGSRDQALYVSDGSTGWYRLMTTPSPETGQTWSPFATIQGGAKAVQSVEVTPGVTKLLVGPTTSGPILQRDYSVNTDNGTAYLAYGTLGSIVLAHPGQLAELVFITLDSTAVGSHPAVSILIDEISGTFESMPSYVPDPTQLPTSTTLYGDRFYFSQTQQPAICRHLMLKFSWPAENYANELLATTIFGGPTEEL